MAKVEIQPDGQIKITDGGSQEWNFMFQSDESLELRNKNDNPIITHSQTGSIEINSSSGDVIDSSSNIIYDNSNNYIPDERLEYSEVNNNIHSAGRLYGGDIIDNGDGTVEVSSGGGLVKSEDANIGTNPSSLNGGQASSISKVSWSTVSSLSLTDNAYNFIYYDYSTGSVEATTDYYSISDTQDFIIGRVFRDGSNIIKRLCGQNLWNFNRRLTVFGEERFPVERASGMMIGETGTRNITITEGVLWAELLNRFNFSAFDSSGTDTFDYWYRDGSGGFSRNNDISQIDNSSYDDGSGTLASLTNNSYGVHWVYGLHNGDVHVVYGRGNYNKLAEARSANPPSEVPELISSYSTLVGKIVIEQGASSFDVVSSPFIETFESSIATEHNQLSGLQGGAADKYYHLNSTDYNNLTDTNAQLDKLHTDQVPLFNGGQKVATREDSPTPYGLIYWDDTNNRVSTTSDFYAEPGGNVYFNGIIDFGINETDPDATLDVDGTIYSTDLGNPSGDTGIDIGWNGSEGLIRARDWDTNNWQRITFQGGNYLFDTSYGGTVSIGESTLNEALGVDGNIATTSGNSVITDQVRAIDSSGLKLTDDAGNGITVLDGGDIQIEDNKYIRPSTGDNARWKFNGSVGLRGEANGSIKFDIDYNSTSTNKIFQITHNNYAETLLKIKENGNTGIGTNITDEKLNIYETTNPAQLFIDSTSAGWGAPAGHFRIYTDDTDRDMYFQTFYGGNWKSRLTITRDGNTGFQTTDPQETVDISGTLGVADDVKLDGSASDIYTTDYELKSTGWEGDNAGNFDVRYLYTDELRAQVFTADVEQALAGSDILGKSVTHLDSSFSLPAEGNTVTITVDDLPSAPDTAVFSVNDYVKIKYYDRSGSTITLASIWGQVTNYSDNTDNTQDWTWTTIDDDGLSGTNIDAESVLVDYGQVGDGFIERTTLGPDTPYNQIATVDNIDSSGLSYTIQSKLGNLNGSTSDTYGALQGYGIHTKNAYFEKNVNIAGTLTAGDENGVGNTFYAGRIGKNIFPNSIEPKTGGRNGIDANGDANYTQNTTDVKSPSGKNDALKVELTSDIRIRISIDRNDTDIENKDLTISFYVRVPDGDSITTGDYDYCDNLFSVDSEKKTYTDNWKRIVITRENQVSYDGDGFAFLDINGLTSGDILYFYGIQWELNDKVTAYEPTDGSITAPTAGDFGMWATQGGFGGTIQNPVVSANSQGLKVETAGYNSNITESGSYIGNWRHDGSSKAVIMNDNGLFGYNSSGNKVFELDIDNNTHKIADFNINNEVLYYGNSTPSQLVIGNGFHTYENETDGSVSLGRFYKDSQWIGMWVRSTNNSYGYFAKNSSDKTELYVKNDSNSTEIDIGDLYRTQGTGNFGMQINTSGNKVFRVSNNTADIAGWNFDNNKLYNGNVYINSTDEQFKVQDTGSNDRVIMGQIDTTDNYYGIEGFDSSGNTIFELSNNQHKIAGFKFDDSTLIATSDGISGDRTLILDGSQSLIEGELITTSTDGDYARLYNNKVTIYNYSTQSGGSFKGVENAGSEEGIQLRVFDDNTLKIMSNYIYKNDSYYKINFFTELDMNANDLKNVNSVSVSGNTVVNSSRRGIFSSIKNNGDINFDANDRAIQVANAGTDNSGYDLTLAAGDADTNSSFPVDGGDVILDPGAPSSTGEDGYVRIRDGCPFEVGNHEVVNTSKNVIAKNIISVEEERSSAPSLGFFPSFQIWQTDGNDSQGGTEGDVMITIYDSSGNEYTRILEEI